MDPRAGPLAGTRVVELAGVGPAPFCAMLLSDLGADVLRIDCPGAVELEVPIDPRFDLAEPWAPQRCETEMSSSASRMSFRPPAPRYGAFVRELSVKGGPSILMTWAPRPASSCVANGPASAVVMSRTVVRCSGPCWRTSEKSRRVAHVRGDDQSAESKILRITRRHRAEWLAAWRDFLGHR